MLNALYVALITVRPYAMQNLQACGDTPITVSGTVVGCLLDSNRPKVKPKCSCTQLWSSHGEKCNNKEANYYEHVKYYGLQSCNIIDTKF